jgi:hypothetical protein
MKCLISRSKLKSLNQHYLEESGNMLVGKIVNNDVILWGKECRGTHLFNNPTRSCEVHTTYIYWHKAVAHCSHDLMKFLNVFSDGYLIPS